MNARPNAWMHQAQQDLALAQLARDNGFQAAACFHASQAAEKALKSALLELGLEQPFTHVLNTLVSQLQDAGINLAIRWMQHPPQSCSIRRMRIRP